VGEESQEEPVVKELVMLHLPAVVESNVPGKDPEDGD
jgi:hypothetical protein